MTYLLDTNTCVGYLRARRAPAIVARIDGLSEGEAVLCSVVKAELHIRGIPQP